MRGLAVPRRMTEEDVGAVSASIGGMQAVAGLEDA